MKLLLAFLFISHIQVVENYGNYLVFTPTEKHNNWSVWCDFNYNNIKDEHETILSKDCYKLRVRLPYGFKAHVELNGACEYNTWVLKDFCEPIDEILHLAGYRGLFRLFDLDNNIVLSQDLYGDDYIDLREYHSGVYVMDINNAKYKLIKK